MNTYKIDNQIWSDYLKTTKDINGNELILNKDYFLPGGKEDNIKEFGLLYTFEAAKRLVIPGWRLPMGEDFHRLKAIKMYYDYNADIFRLKFNLKLAGLYKSKYNHENPGSLCFLHGSKFNVNPHYTMGCSIDEFAHINEYQLLSINTACSVRLIKI